MDMANFFSKILPNIDPINSCSAPVGGSCAFPLASIVSQIDPLITVSNSINNAARGTQTDSCKFSDFFVAATHNYLHPPGALFQETLLRPTLDQKTVFENWLAEMDALVFNNYEALKCLNSLLCECKPVITYYFSNLTYDEWVKNGRKAGTDAFAQTFGPYPIAGTSQLEFKIVFYLNLIDGTTDGSVIDRGYVFGNGNGRLNRSIALGNEYIIKAFLSNFGVNLTIPPGKHIPPLANPAYRPDTPNFNYEIGFIIHELGHVVDYYKDRIYWSRRNPAHPNDPSKNLTSHVHAYMWQAWYYLELWQGFNFRFSGIQDFMNLPIPLSCTTLKNKLSDRANYPPDLLG